MTADQPRDLLGRPLAVGDWIAYPCQYGHTIYLKVGRVVGIESDHRWLGQQDGWMISVMGVDSRWSGKMRVNSRPGKLTDPTRIVRLDAAEVPEEYKTALEGRPDGTQA